MPAGNKKKKKPAAANSARGFATTSVQSTKKIEAAKEIESADAPATRNPENTQAAATRSNDTSNPANSSERELHELSAEEFAAHLETSELQLFVEKHASKVRKDASRQVSRLQTDKRLLRGQADFMSVKDWLPEELMQQVIDLTLEDLNRDSQQLDKTLPTVQDDLISKVWALQESLLDLDLPEGRVREAISFVLRQPPQDDSGSHLWGVEDALDWLALYCSPEELLEYDLQKAKQTTVENDLDEEVLHSDSSKKKHDSPQSDGKSHSTDSPPELDLVVSDVESDAEPDELLATYMRTKVKLYEVDPSSVDSVGKGKKAGKGGKIANSALETLSPGVRKLKQKLQKIEADVLFDKQEAEMQWETKKVELLREAGERKKLQLHEQATSEEHLTSERIDRKANGTANPSDEAERLGTELLMETEDGDDDLLGGMFDALPGISELPPKADGTPAQQVKVRDFGRLTGINPKRVLEEACKARDTRCAITYKQVSSTTYACQHSVSITWSRSQEILDSGYLCAVNVRHASKRLLLTMTGEATIDLGQSEAYAATVALFLIFSDSPKEEKAHMRLPPAYRDLWDELVQTKREYTDAKDRQQVKELRTMIESEIKADDDDDDGDEGVVFNANLRRLNGNASGAATPTSRPLTPRLDNMDASQALQDIWTRKVSTQSYQRMLLARMNLPMFHAKASAIEAIGRNQVTIVVGDTGSGKSTQVPQFILEHELSQGRQCKIYCTEPRRISAISLAQRVSEELGEQKGDVGTARSLVGYAIRLESHTTAQTRLVFATVGIVLRMLENADGLKDITHLVLDEVHERSIDTDFLLIVLRSLLLARPDLKVVLMSATVDAQKFSNYLDGAPIISVPGRTFPVGARFLEDAIELTGHTNEDVPAAETHEEDDGDIEQRDGKSNAPQQLTGYSAKTRKTLASYDEYRVDTSLIVKLLEKIAYSPQYKDFSKAVLVFLPGIAEIRTLNDLLGGHPSFSKGWRIHALHSSFSSEDQQAAFEVPPTGVRKIVLATNIAETGITIPDVTCVIDTGKHREMRFDERRQMSRLIQSFIARANAKQRRGRAGRVQEGICFHLFTKHRFENLMIDQQTPEMLRLSLQDLVMRVKICKLGNIEEALSQALDPPSSKNIRRAIDALVEVGALTESEQLTSLGSQLAKLPLDAQLGKLILLGATFGCLDFAATVAATLSSKSPFLTPMHARKQADSVRLGYKRGDSDLLTMFNAYSTWRKVCTTPGISEFSFCNKNFLSPQNLANIEDLKAQLLTSLSDAGFVNLSSVERIALTKVRPGARQRNFVSLPEKYTKNDDNDVVASSVVAWSFYPKIVKREGKGWRNIANNQSLGLHPTSVNKHNLPSHIQYLSFYSIMQSSSRFTNSQETSAVSDFALVLLAGEAVFHMYAGVIVVDGNRLRLKVRDWRTMIVLKTLRAKAKEALSRTFKYPGKDLGDKQRRWMEVIERIFDQRKKD